MSNNFPLLLTVKVADAILPLTKDEEAYEDLTAESALLKSRSLQFEKLLLPEPEEPDVEEVVEVAAGAEVAADDVVVVVVVVVVVGIVVV
jgi:hypothetical protein